MKTPSPAISVVIAVHNGLPYLEEAMRSIMNQSFRDIEIVVIDDASTDGSSALLQRLVEEDDRIRVLTNETNLKLAASLNRGLEAARAPLIARMDADDIAYPDRLAIQKTYMDANPDVVLCGMSVRIIDPDGTVVHTARRGRDALATRWLARFFMPLSHPTFLMRAKFPDGTAPRYRGDFPVTEDYDFVAHLLEKGDAVTLKQIGLDYRTHDASATQTNAERQKADARTVAERIQNRELPPALRDAITPLNAAYLGFEAVDPAALFKGLRQMLAYDSTHMPNHRRWLRRQSAQLAYTALRHGGLTQRQRITAFLVWGPDFVISLAMRGAETRNFLPKRLRSDQFLN